MLNGRFIMRRCYLSTVLWYEVVLFTRLLEKNAPTSHVWRRHQQMLYHNRSMVSIC